VGCSVRDWAIWILGAWAPGPAEHTEAARPRLGTVTVCYERGQASLQYSPVDRKCGGFCFRPVDGDGSYVPVFLSNVYYYCILKLSYIVIICC